MKKLLSEDDRKHLNTLVSEIEKRTKTQIVLSVTNRSDSYVELPWKAFASGTTISSLFVFIFYSVTYNWFSQITLLVAAIAILSGGITFALLTVFVPAFARIFLTSSHSEEEVRQYAESLFLKRELFATKHRKSILLHISLFERKVYIHPDKGITNLVSNDEIETIINTMIENLKKNEISKAFENGLDLLSLILNSDKSPEDYENEISDDIIEEKL
jgi:putative membrane protein